MKKFLFMAVMLVASTLSIWAQETAQPTLLTPAQQEIIDLSHKKWDWALRHGLIGCSRRQRSNQSLYGHRSICKERECLAIGLSLIHQIIAINRYGTDF